MLLIQVSHELNIWKNLNIILTFTAASMLNDKYLPSSNEGGVGWLGIETFNKELQNCI